MATLAMAVMLARRLGLLVVLIGNDIFKLGTWSE